jgi:hypothetical protein
MTTPDEAVCTVAEPHCSLCGQTGVSCEAHGYSSCCNEPMVNADGCHYPELHDANDAALRQYVQDQQAKGDQP